MSFLKLDDLNWNALEFGEQIPIIKAVTGRGKTTLVVDELSKRYEMPYLLEPTNSIEQQALSRFSGKVTRFSESDLILGNLQDERLRVACFFKLVKFIADGNDILSIPDLIVIDEIDQIAKWSMCFPGYLEAWDWLLSNRQEMNVCGLSATPELLTRFMSESPFVEVQDKKPPQYQADQIEVAHMRLKKYLEGIDFNGDEKVIIYVQSATKCAELAKEYPNAGFLVSKHNKERLTPNGLTLGEMMLEQSVSNDKAFGEIGLRDYILETKELPDETSAIFFNDAYLTGVNIEDERVKHIICETVDQAAIIQALGRVRHDISRLTVLWTKDSKRSFNQRYERWKLFNEKAADSKDVLEVWHEEEQLKLKQYYSSNQSEMDFDILTYKANDEVKVNPFAKAYYQYCSYIWEQLEQPQTTKEYFDSFLLPFSKSGKISYPNNGELRQPVKNKERLTDEILNKYLGKKLFKQDREQLALELSLEDKQGHIRKWPTVKKFLIGQGFNIQDNGSKAINPHTGTRQAYVVIDPKI